MAWECSLGAFPGYLEYHFDALQFFFLKKIYLILHLLWMFCMHACMCTRGMPGSLESQKRSLDPLEQEFRMVVNHQAGAGNWACTICENSNCSYLLSYYSSPLAGFLLLLCMCTHVVPSTVIRSQFSCSPAEAGDWPQVARLTQHAPLPTEPHCPSVSGSLFGFFWWFLTLLFES